MYVDKSYDNDRAILFVSSSFAVVLFTKFALSRARKPSKMKTTSE